MIFKAYDVRGLVPDELDVAAAVRIGAAFARFAGGPEIIVGHDCRVSSPDLAAGLIEGITGQGVDVIHLGEITTDMLYFASGAYDRPGVVLTASHNPAAYNGMKFCLAGAAPVGRETGLADIQATAEGPPPARVVAGTVERRDARSGYVEHLFSIVDASHFADLRVIADGGNGMAGVVLDRVFTRIPVELRGLYLEPDGTFPNHPADPLQPENLTDLITLMEAERPDLGVAFDGDADRAFFVDDQLVPLPGSSTTAIVADWFLAREPGATIVHNLICSHAVPETVLARGGTPVRTRVGHSYIKQVMAETGAVFGGEHSGHYYFRDNFRADSGILTMLVLLQVVSEAGVPLSELRRAYELYTQSGEINFDVSDQQATLDTVTAAFADVEPDRLDGLTFDLGDQWFNLRPSNTEPKLRLNAEADSPEAVAALVRRVGVLIERGTEEGT